MKNIIAAIGADANLNVTGFERVHGGDINVALKLETSSGFFFLKLNEADKYPVMFQKEREGLEALEGKSDLIVPQVIADGVVNNYQYLLMQWLETGRQGSNFWSLFAQGLAAIHKNTNEAFGWSSNNYIGSLVQPNNRHQSWATFYAAERILPLCRHLFDAGIFGKTDISNAQALCNKFGELFPAEKPALLHGDLWSGNFMPISSSTAAIFDPAVYYGHREMDLGMAKLFGGFDAAFFYHYHEVFPLEKDWLSRLELTQLYPLIVHAVLFGGGYVNRCSAILQRWR